MKIISFLDRNKKSIDGGKILESKIFLEYWKDKVNVGDFLAKIIYEYMLDYYKLDIEKTTAKPIHLNTIGSIIGMKNYDAVIWGSGLHCAGTVANVIKHRNYVKYDVRAVRGPLTEQFLEAAGYKCPHVYGDPAIIMPLVYKPKVIEKIYDVSVVLHLSDNEKYDNDGQYNYINVATNDYQHFIDEICKSKLVISSSLHGIILAETYGVPAIFLRKGMANEEMKFYDWYFSTNRHQVVAIDSIEQYKSVKPMPLPDLDEMRKNIIKSFPKDLWDR